MEYNKKILNFNIHSNNNGKSNQQKYPTEAANR